MPENTPNLLMFSVANNIRKANGLGHCHMTHLDEARDVAGGSAYALF